MDSCNVAGDERTTKSKVLETGAALTQVNTIALPPRLSMTGSKTSCSCRTLRPSSPSVPI